MKKRNFYYDIEIFPNYFCITFINTAIDVDKLQEFIDLDIELLNKDISRDEYENNEELWTCIMRNIQPIIFEVFADTNELQSLHDFIREDVAILINFNGYRYDNIILDLIMLNVEDSLTITNLDGKVIDIDIN